MRQADLWEHLAVPSILFIYLSSISKRKYCCEHLIFYKFWLPRSSVSYFPTVM